MQIVIKLYYNKNNPHFSQLNLERNTQMLAKPRLELSTDDVFFWHMAVFKYAGQIVENNRCLLCPNASQAGLKAIRFLRFKLSNKKKANVSRAELKLYSQYIDTADGKKI